MLILLATVALPAEPAAPAAPAAPDPPDSGAEASEVGAEGGAAPLAAAATPEERIDEARLRALRGDWEGVRIVAEEALRIPGPHEPDARYLVALGWEFGGEPLRALEIYDALLPVWPSDRRLADLQFRRAEALTRAERWGDALQQLADIDEDGLGTGERLQVRVLTAVARLRTDRKPNRALAELHAALEGASPEDAPYHQSMARVALMEQALAEAGRLAFVGNKKRKGRQLEDRARLVAFIEDQAVATLELRSPMWEIEALHLAALSFHQFGQALLDESPVKGLDEAQRAHYRASLAEKVENLWIKALRRAERAVQHGVDTGWVGPPVPEVEATRQRIQADIEALATTPPRPAP